MRMHAHTWLFEGWTEPVEQACLTQYTLGALVCVNAEARNQAAQAHLHGRYVYHILTND